MAFYNKADDLSRDPTIPRNASAIDQRYTRGDGVISAVLILLVVAAAFGLYFLYADSGSPSRTVNEPSTTQLAPAPAPAPATQPSTKLRHHRLRSAVVAASLLASGAAIVLAKRIWPAHPRNHKAHDALANC